MKCCINGENLIRLLYLSAKLFKFEIQKCGQILCAHKPYFLMPGHIYVPRLDSSCRHMDRAIHSDTYFATLIEYLPI